ncbi:S26 family signal peptidase, partial [Streptomyces sp. T-3]|nr:S26 family signal peptidase [Streptomyces sp. T-3]
MGLAGSGLSLLLISGGLTALYLRRSYVVITVEGGSMSPTLSDGDRVVVRRRALARIRTGDVVVLKPPFTSGEFATDALRTPGWNIKRVAALPGQPVPAGTA